MRHGYIKSFQLLKIVELAMLCRFNQPIIWKTLEDHLLYNSEYETVRDIMEVLEKAKDIPHFQNNEGFWQHMMEKIISMRQLLSCRDIIDIVDLYSLATSTLSPEKQARMIEHIKDNSKQCVVEEIDSLGIKEILSLLELYREDRDFKKFLAHNLKEKLVKAANL
jgi:hypothetical protein